MYREFDYECVSFSAGIRNLDAPHLPCQPLIPATSAPDPFTRTPCNTETCVDPHDVAARTSPLPASSGDEPSGPAIPTHRSTAFTRETGADTVITSGPPPASPDDESSDPVIPTHWSTVFTREAGADTVIISGPLPASPDDESSDPVIPTHWSMVDAHEAGADTVIIASSSTLPATTNETRDMPGTLTVIFLEGDEDSVNSSVFVNTSHSVHSAHSSDVYYTDKRYDVAFAAYIEEEENNNAVGVETEVSTAFVQVE